MNTAKDYVFIFRLNIKSTRMRVKISVCVCVFGQKEWYIRSIVPYWTSYLNEISTIFHTGIKQKIRMICVKSILISRDFACDSLIPTR